MSTDSCDACSPLVYLLVSMLVDVIRVPPPPPPPPLPLLVSLFNDKAKEQRGPRRIFLRVGAREESTVSTRG